MKIDQPKKLTKQTVLSDIARLFYPLGLIKPVITIAKIDMQELFKSKLDRNDLIPNSLTKSWIEFTNSVKTSENL